MENKANAMSFAAELGLFVRPTNIGVQKIDGIIAFSMTDKTNRVKFFAKSFLVANVSPKVVFEMQSHTLTSADVNSYTLKVRI